VSVDQRRATRELVEFRQECARPFFDDQLRVAQRVLAAHRHAALQDDEHPQTDFAGPKERVPFGIGGDRAEPPQTFDLIRLQHREHLVAPHFKCGICHDRVH